jgi:hypothetical protein
MTTFHQSMEQSLWCWFTYRENTMNYDMPPGEGCVIRQNAFENPPQKTRTLGKTSTFQSLFHFSFSCIVEWPTPLLNADAILYLSSKREHYRSNQGMRRRQCIPKFKLLRGLVSIATVWRHKSPQMPRRPHRILFESTHQKGSMWSTNGPWG